MNKPMFSWADRFALIDHFTPSDDQITATFGVTQDELDTARQLRKVGSFGTSKMVDFNKHANLFTDQSLGSQPTAYTQIKPKSGKTMFARPTTTTTPTVHAKRGRKGDRIQQALSKVPTTPTPVAAFAQEHNVSLAVLRQSKRFMENLPQEVQRSIGKINVRQDKNTKQLVIWRESSK